MSRRRARRNGRSQRRGRQGNAAAIAKVALGMAVLGGLGFAYLVVTERAEAIDPVSLCDRSGPSEVHVVLLDASDPLDGVQAERAKAEVFKSARRSPKNSRIDIYVADTPDGRLAEPAFSKCNPGAPARLDALYSDVERRQEEFDTAFLEAIEETMTSVLSAEEASASPIIESIRSASTRSFSRLNDDTPVRLTIVSDMVQNTQLLRQRSPDARFDEFEQSAGWPSALVNLHGANIHVIYVARPQYRALQGIGHQSWWQNYFNAVNGRVVSMDTI